MKRALSYLQTVHQHRTGQSPLPRMLTYIVTFSCNAKCIMCDSWRKPSPGDLNLKEIERIYQQLPTMDVVRLTGGEPFVRKDITEIAALTQTLLKPMVLHVTTNGFLSKRIVEFCEQRDASNLLYLLVSVDGYGDKHNEVRGIKSAWDSVRETLEALAPRQNELRLKLAINQTVVDAEGIEHYKKLRDYTRQWSIQHNMVMAYDVSATYSIDDTQEVAPENTGDFATFGEFSHEQLDELLGEVEQDLDRLELRDRVAKRYYIRGIRNRLLHEIGTPNPKCVALTSHLRLFPNGDVPTCQFNTVKAGNLRRQSFDDFWNSEQAAKQRLWVNQCKGCWAECEILPNAFYSGDLIRSLLPGAS